MFSKKEITETGNKIIIRYRFNINDPVLSTNKDKYILNSVILSRYNVNGENYYKIGDKINTKICKEKELIHR